MTRWTLMPIQPNEIDCLLSREVLLPDVEHVHVTRHPDGTITAVPMEEVAEMTMYDISRQWWVDTPRGAA